MMAKYHLPVNPKMIAQGDYSEFVDKQIEKLLDDNPDAQAIVFANDEMAFSGYRVCEKRGLKVGKDILITGLMTVNVHLVWNHLLQPFSRMESSWDEWLYTTLLINWTAKMFSPEEFLFLCVSENPAAARNSFRKFTILQ